MKNLLVFVLGWLMLANTSTQGQSHPMAPKDFVVGWSSSTSYHAGYSDVFVWRVEMGSFVGGEDLVFARLAAFLGYKHGGMEFSIGARWPTQFGRAGFRGGIVLEGNKETFEERLFTEKVIFTPFLGIVFESRCGLTCNLDYGWRNGLVYKANVQMSLDEAKILLASYPEPSTFVRFGLGLNLVQVRHWLRPKPVEFY